MQVPTRIKAVLLAGGMGTRISEESAVRVVEEQANTWVGNPGNPMIAQVGKGLVRKGTEAPFEGVIR